MTAVKREDTANQTITVTDRRIPPRSSPVRRMRSPSGRPPPRACPSRMRPSASMASRSIPRTTPIYSVCVPPSTGAAPCATTTASPASTGVKVLVRDAFGNRVADGTGVTIGINPSSTNLVSTGIGTTDGITRFGDQLTFDADNTSQRLKAASANGASGLSQVFLLAPDARACNGQRCENTASAGAQGAGNQKSFNVLTTAVTDGFFVQGTTNVRLTSQFLPGGTFTTSDRCGAGQVVGQGSEAIVAGAGLWRPAPRRRC